MRKLMFLLMTGILILLAGCGGNAGIPSSGLDSGSQGDRTELSTDADSSDVQQNAGFTGEITLGGPLAAKRVGTSMKRLELAWEEAELSIKPGMLDEGTEVSVLSANLPKSPTLILSGSAFTVEVDGPQARLGAELELELSFKGLPHDATRTDFDVYKAVSKEDRIEIAYGWARLEDGVLSKRIVHEPGAVYFLVNQGRALEAREASSHGWNVPLLTTQDPDPATWVKGGDDPPTKLNIVLIHGLDPGDYRQAPGNLSYSRHWDKYSAPGVEEQVLLDTFPQAWREQTTVWHYYYDPIWKPMDRIADELAMRIQTQILYHKSDAEVVLAGYSKGAMLGLAAYDELQDAYGHDDGIVDALVALDGASLGCEAVNIMECGGTGTFFGIPMGQGTLDLRSIYDVEYKLVNKWYFPATQTNNSNDVLRARINAHLTQLQDKTWFYPVTGQYEGIFSEKGFGWLFNKIIALEVAEGEWRPDEATCLRRDGLLRYDGVVAGYSQELEGAMGEFNTEEVPEYEHNLKHVAVINSRDAQVTSWLQEILQEIACRLLNQAPIAELTTTPIPAEGEAPLLVTFDASGSTSPEGYDLSFEWDFDGDGLYNEQYNGESGFEGTNIAQHTYSDPGTYNASVKVSDCYGAKTVESVVVVVQAAVPEYEICFAGKVDGQWGIYVTDAQGGYYTKVCDSTIVTGTAFSPDGSKIAFTSRETGPDQVFVVNVDGTDKHMISPGSNYYVISSWQEDNQILLFRHTTPENEEYSVRPDGSDFRMITEGNGVSERSTWLSPSHMQAVYNRGTPYVAASGRLYIVDFPTYANPRRLASIAGDSLRQDQPCWCHATDLIAFTAWPNGTSSFQVYVVKPDGSELRCLSPGGTQEQYPRFSPDGSYVVVQSTYNSSSYNIWVIKTSDPNQRTRITNGFEEASSPDWYVP